MPFQIRARTPHLSLLVAASLIVTSYSMAQSSNTAQMKSRTSGQNASSIKAQDLGSPPRDQKFEWYARQAKSLGKSTVLLQPGIATPTGSNFTLTDMLKYFGVIRAKLIGQHVQVDHDYLTTWYRFEEEDVLSSENAQTTDTHSIKLDPARSSPLKDKEFFVVEEGGSIKIDGVTVIEQIPGVRPVSIGQDYVLFARLGADRGAAVAGGPAGMFQINGDQLIPRAEDSTPLTEDLSQKFGLSLDQLSAYLRNGH